MPTVLSALQLNNNQVGFFVDAKQINPPPAYVPIAELFRNHHCLVGDDLDLVSQQSLNILPLTDAPVSKGCFL